MIRYRCPACDREIVTSDDQAGARYTCACGNVSIVPARPPEPTAEPTAEPQPPNAEQAPGPAKSPEVVYQGRPSQLRNLWVFLGFFAVIVLAVWPLRSALASVFKQSAWDWYIALIIIAAYFVWMAIRVLKLKCTRYTVTTENILIEQGVLFKDLDDIELFRVNDIRIRRGLLQRVLGVGDVCIESTDKSMPVARLRSIPEPRAAFEKIRRASLDTDERRGVTQLKK